MKCKICKKSFNREKFLRKHMLDEHDQLDYEIHMRSLQETISEKELFN